MQPLIGVVAAERALPTPTGGTQRAAVVGSAILSVLTEHGACPLLLSPSAGRDAAARLIELVDGLLLPGGRDLDPSSYGQPARVEYLESVKGCGTAYRRAASERPDRELDAFEIALYRAARARNLPVLGICRGMQLINVAEGGTLHQELSEAEVRHALGEDGFVHHHELWVEPDSLAQRCLDTTRYFTSSLHHQSVAELGQGLSASARAPDGTVEMLEAVAPDSFVLGIQGHVELTRTNLPRFEGAFARFVAHAAQRHLSRAHCR